jgi:molybdopterin-guanine dinucleotide biosynthesis protein A
MTPGAPGRAARPDAGAEVARSEGPRPLAGRAEVTGLILAGGLGRRMSPDGNGCDKGWVRFREKPLIETTMERLRPQVGSLMINANSSLERYRALGPQVHPDRLPGFLGPLAGVQAGLWACPTPWLATVPCDTPCFPIDLVERLAVGICERDASVAIARSPSGVHPAFMLVHRSLLSALDDYLARGGRRVREWCRIQQGVSVDFEDDSAFGNLNTPEELSALEMKR